jgi:hypothetical protein
MKKIFFAFTIVMFVSCSKEKQPDPVRPPRTNPEVRNQEGTKLLGVSSIANNQLSWSTIYYDGSSNRIIKTIDSSMDINNTDINPSANNITIYNYDVTGKISSMTLNGSGIGVKPYARFNYTATGQIAEEIIEGAGKRVFTYNGSGQLASDSTFQLTSNQCEAVKKWNYDGAGNITAQEEWWTDSITNKLTKNVTHKFVYDDKPTPYTSIDPNSFFDFGEGKHNAVSVVSTFLSGSVVEQTYTYEYNRYNLPKLVARHLPTGELQTTRFYYY